MSSNDMSKLMKLYQNMLDIKIAEKEALERENAELSRKVSEARSKQTDLKQNILRLQLDLGEGAFGHGTNLQLKQINKELEETLDPLMKKKEDLIKFKQSFYGENNEKLKTVFAEQVNKMELINISALKLEAEKSDKIVADYKTKENFLKEQHLEKITKIKEASSEIQSLTKSIKEARKDQEYQELTLARNVDHKKHRLEVLQSRSADLSREYNSLQSSKQKLQKRLESAKVQKSNK